VETAGGESGCINTINTADESWLSECDSKQKNKEFKMAIIQLTKTKLSPS
jgi:hypothetical protein